MLDTTEFEAKFYPVDKTTYREKLTSIGAHLIHAERKMRRSLIDHRFHPEFTCNYIRVRDEGDVIRLSAKTHAEAGGKLSDQKEIDVEVSDYAKTLQILEKMGFKPEMYQETLRETWEFEGAEITIDTWPGLETYSEIEAKSEGQVKSIAEMLGFDWNKKIITACAEIYAEVYQLTMIRTLELLTNISFEHNPFENLPKHAIMNTQSV